MDHSNSFPIGSWHNLWSRSPSSRHFELSVKQMARQVTCKGKSYRRPSLEEVAHFDFDFDKRLMSHVELSWLEPGKVRQITIVGERRSAKVDCLRQVVEIYEDNDGPNSCVNISPNNTIFDEVKHFVNSIRMKTITRILVLLAPETFVFLRVWKNRCMRNKQSKRG